MRILWADGSALLWADGSALLWADAGGYATARKTSVGADSIGGI